MSAPRPLKLIESKVNRRGVIHKNLIKIKYGLLNIRTLLNSSSKAVLVNNLRSDYHIDLFWLAETWLSHEDYVSLNESTPRSHINTHFRQCTSQGGGATAMFDSSLVINSKPKL